MRTRTPSIRRGVAAAAVGLISFGLLAALPSSADAVPENPSGDGWTILPVAGGYQVSLELDEPLPVVDDAPTLVVDGHDYGIATESADGLSLSVITSDPAVADADEVEMAWSSGAASHVEPYDAPVTAEEAAPLRALKNLKGKQAARVAALTDGGTPGTFSYVEDDYDFGDQAVPLAGIGGIRGELTGRVYLPTTGGARPTVVLLHGRHTSCSTLVQGTQNPNRWPCVPGQIEVPSYKGYDALGQLLATHGYAVVSISANAINANDAQLTLDNGALARGQLVIDSLELIKKANAGQPVSYYDAALAQDVTLDQALASTVPDSSGPIPPGTLTAADLVGRFDLTNVGLMGHSRGGEGVVSAVTLNQMRANPFGITSVLPLAPVDFARMTVTDTDMLVILPYCDGDVSNQQGQHFSDDSRYAFDDNALRSTVWVMGANHNFFNTIWTPGVYPYSVSDDWSPTGSSTRNDTVCSTSMTPNQRLSAADQYQAGAVIMADWFRVTMGGEDEFLPMFDGTVQPELDSVPAADVRAIATAPAADRLDINRLTEPSSAIVVTGGSTGAAVCASTANRTVAQPYAACATASAVRSTSAMPHWTPASFGPNVPASPMTRYTWTAVSGSSAGAMIVRVPSEARDGTAYETLSFKVAPDETVLSGTDMTITVADGSGATWSTRVTQVNPLAINRMPISGHTTLNKIVLQQVSIPTSSITGVDLTDIQQIRFAGYPGADGQSGNNAPGGVYLTDLAWSNSATGTPVVAGSMPTVGVVSTTVEEGAAGEWTRSAAVVLSRPMDTTVSAYFSAIPGTSNTNTIAPAMEKVTFAPGETCRSVTVPVLGDSTPGTAATTAYKIDVTNPQGVITGDQAFGQLTLREDDGLTAGTPAPEVGVQGDPCAEYAATSRVFGLGRSPSSLAGGAPVTLTATGYRSGETVTFTEADTTVGAVLAGPDGTASLQTTPAGAGTHTYTATGAGSKRVSAGAVTVLAGTTTSLAMSPSVPAIKQPVTLTATVGGAPAGAVVTFTDGDVTLGTAPVTGSTAELSVPGGFAAGDHAVTATLPGSATTAGSVSQVVAFTLTKGTTTTVLTLSAPSTTYGAGATGTVTVEGADGGTVTVGFAGTSVEVPVDPSGTASFEIPASLGVGTYEVTASYSGSDTVEASSAAATSYDVTVAGSATKVKSKGKVAKGKKLTVKVTVVGVDGVDAPSGTVVLGFGGLTKTVRLADGVASTQVRATKAGKRKLTVTYAGDESYAGSSTSKVVTVKKK